MENQLHFTYQTKNLINDKTYIGIHSTNDVDDGYLGSGTLLHESMNKHGKENFKREILSFFETREEALAEEEYLVDKDWVNNKSNYNIKEGGRHPTMTDAIRKKMSLAHTGKIVSPETGRKISLGNTGKVTAQETRRKISISMTGKVHSDETKSKMSLAKLGKPRSEEAKMNISKAMKESWAKRLADAKI